ncbi:unnamed protein product [Acanthoscelides obtectus]|uniref:Carbonic anhydrase n=1 Tax=Acanthoscelides obtectus TaxID=200917 RepID=A0A9P0PDC9_ACAOB|nr:unnamed protein product [Acanthoscelides obtectus]CAK1674918.1 Putative carbonic anhydrase 3 [Acanthoscelides obtectus]
MNIRKGYESSASSWHYQDEEHWPQGCKEGKHQSPIALNARDATLIDFEPFSLNGYGESVTAVLKNNGHSAEIRPKMSGDKPSISGGGFNHTYKLDHLHFHWQSEHVIDRYRFPLELHLVHYAKEFGNLSAALQHPGGIAVLAVMFDLSPDDDAEFEPLVSIIDTLKDKVGQPVNLTNFVIKNFIPRNVAGYYRYDGSLTTPACNEGVIWTVFTNTIPISKEQVKVFDEMRTEDHKILKQNYRSLQSLNERKLYLKRSPLRDNFINSATTHSISVTLLYSLISFIVLY